MIEIRFLILHHKYDLKEAQCVRQIVCKMYLKEAFGIILERDYQKEADTNHLTSIGDSPGKGLNFCDVCYSVVLQKLLIFCKSLFSGLPVFSTFEAIDFGSHGVSFRLVTQYNIQKIAANLQVMIKTKIEFHLAKCTSF